MERVSEWLSAEVDKAGGSQVFSELGQAMLLAVIFIMLILTGSLEWIVKTEWLMFLTLGRENENAGAEAEAKAPSAAPPPAATAAAALHGAAAATALAADREQTTKAPRTGPLRAAVVYGSESGTAKRMANRIAANWPAAHTMDISSAMPGNDVAAKLEWLRSEHELLIVATSSFGEGDPPDNYRKFLLELTRHAAAGDRPLAGMQHAVLGFGSSSYETYQNVPRLTDRLLGQCGSRRLMARVEVDADEDDAAERAAGFEGSFAAALRTLPDADAADACEWTTPGHGVFEKSESDLGGGGEGLLPGGGVGILVMGGVIAAAAAAAAAASGFVG